ncbi:MAG: archaellin/type IV pilin N-terminal domain-containing protein [Dehalococcoidales bacterium]
MYNKYFKHEKGITGLETAIILIAFVVVAAVFAYTALSAGLFSTQKAQEAVYSGLKEAQSTMELRGGIIATAGTLGAHGTIKQLTFVVANVLGGEPIDFTQPTPASANTGVSENHSSNKVVINYIDSDQTVTDLFWTCVPLGTTNGNALLETGEKFQITIGSNDTDEDGGNLVNALHTPLTVNKTFTLEIVTSAGAVLTLERTTPAYIDTKMNLR